MTKRDTFKYQFKVGNKIVHGGVTNDIKQVGRRTTPEAASKWEKDHGFS